MPGVDENLAQVHEAMRQSQYRDAIKIAALLPIGRLMQTELSQLMDAMLSAAAALADGSEAELQAYDLVVKLGDRLGKQSMYRAAAQLKVNSALFNKGVALAQLGRNREAIAVYDKLVTRAGGARDLGLRENAVRALFNKGASLRGLDRREEAIAVYDDLIRRFANETAPAMLEAVGKALVNKGITLAEMNRLQEAIEVLDEVIVRWHSSTDAVLRERAARALLNKAAALVELGRDEEARVTYEKVLTHFGSDPNASIREQVALARVRIETLDAQLRG
jgi:tetratricopeptide (TPR) repeat protein